MYAMQRVSFFRPNTQPFRDALEQLVQNVRDAERAACIAIAEDEATRPKKIPHSHPEAQAYEAAAVRIAERMRERGGM